LRVAERVSRWAGMRMGRAYYFLLKRARRGHGCRDNRHQSTHVVVDPLRRLLKRLFVRKGQLRVALENVAYQDVQQLLQVFGVLEPVAVGFRSPLECRIQVS
jgi:hypothetical protein